MSSALIPVLLVELIWINESCYRHNNPWLKDKNRKTKRIAFNTRTSQLVTHAITILACASLTLPSEREIVCLSQVWTKTCTRKIGRNIITLNNQFNYWQFIGRACWIPNARRLMIMMSIIFKVSSWSCRPQCWTKFTANFKKLQFDDEHWKIIQNRDPSDAWLRQSESHSRNAWRWFVFVANSSTGIRSQSKASNHRYRSINSAGSSESATVVTKVPSIRSRKALFFKKLLLFINDWIQW